MCVHCHCQGYTGCLRIIFLYQKEMSIFSLFRFERNEHNHMKVKLNTKIKKNRDQSKTHIARCSCNPLNLCSACIPMQVMHAIHVMLAHQVAHTIQISLVHTLSPIFINFYRFLLGLSVSSVFINFSYFIQLYRGRMSVGGCLCAFWAQGWGIYIV